MVEGVGCPVVQRRLGESSTATLIDAPGVTRGSSGGELVDA
jgi:hypothetical protein